MARSREAGQCADRGAARFPGNIKAYALPDNEAAEVVATAPFVQDHGISRRGPRRRTAHENRRENVFGIFFTALLPVSAQAIR